jgi:hypothetical protein
MKTQLSFNFKIVFDKSIHIILINDANNKKSSVFTDSQFLPLLPSKLKLSRYRHAGAKEKRRDGSYSLTSALDWGVVRVTPLRHFTRGKGLPVPIG